MTHHTQSITALPKSPDQDRHSRMIKYSVTMGIRIVCIVAMLFVHGWWLIVFGVGAVLLPYFAVVIANASKIAASSEIERPGNIVPTDQARGQHSSTTDDSTDPQSDQHG